MKKSKAARSKWKPDLATEITIVNELLQTPIDSDEIIYIVQEMARRYENGDTPRWTTPFAILYDHYPKGDPRPLCIIERMQCLGSLMGDPRMRIWSVKDADTPYQLLGEAIFKATAKATLYISGEQVCFVADEFFDIVLIETPANGNA